MRPLSAPEFVRAWEGGQARPLAERALLLLAYACPEESWEELAALPIGYRDARLLTLREWALGTQLNCLAHCPACTEPLDLSFSVDDVRAEAVAPPAADLTLQVEGYDVAFRLPDSTDLATLGETGDEDAARRCLLERCLLSARRNGKKRPVNRLPAAVLDAVVARMAETDPQADVHTVLTCPACTHTWQASFDIVSFFWAEIEDWAHRTLRDVHRLASAYGWGETEILALSPQRRRFYLEMVG